MAERAPGRPRDHRLDDAIVAAAHEVMLERGYNQTSYAEIARRSGVGTPAIYRRWPSKADIAIDMVEHEARPLPIPDTGDIRRDLVVFVRLRIRSFSSPVFRQVVLQVAAEALGDEKLAHRVRTRFAGYREPNLEPRIRKAIAARQLRADTDPDRLIDLMMGPVAMPMIFMRPMPHERDAGKIVDLALDGFVPRRSRVR